MKQQPMTLETLLDRKSKSARGRLVYERDWSLNLAYVAGQQNVDWDASAGKIFSIAPENQMRTVHNIMLKIHRVEKAKLIKTKPVPAVLPVSEDHKDLLTARVATAYCKQLMDEWGFEAKLRHSISWAIQTGNVFLKWYWAGGRNQLTVVSPFDIYPDPYAKKFCDARWIIHQQFMDVEAARGLYGEYPKANLAHLQESKTRSMTEIESSVYTPMGYGNDGVPGVIVYEYYEKPCKAVPEGRYVVFTEDGVVFETAFPFKHGKLPFTQIGHLERPNTFWYFSILDSLRKIQDEINRTESQVIYNRNMANGKWYLPPGLELEDDPDGSLGQILKPVSGSAGQEPVLMQLNSLPPWVSEEINRYKDSMQDIAGQHEVSNGGVPGRVEAATAIQLLQEQDDTVLRETIDSIEEAVSDGFMMALQLFKQYGTTLDIQVYDKDGNFEKLLLKNDLLDPKCRVVVQTTSGLPQTIAGKWDRVLLMWNSGLLGENSHQALEMLDIGKDAPDLIPQAQDRKNAWRENLRIAKGEIVKARKWEDHEAHITEHKKFMKGPEFDGLDMETQKKFEYHLKTHEDWNLVVLQEEGVKLALMQGGAAPAQATSTMPTPDASKSPGMESNGSPTEVISM